MKRAITCLLFVLFIGMATTALADPPAKSTILHCGCTPEGDGMEYVAISVSSKTKGHDAHVVGSIDSCFDGVETFTDFVRTGSDCQVDGPPLGDPIEACGEQLEGDPCGSEVIE
jgi:hypothetical protein